MNRAFQRPMANKITDQRKGTPLGTGTVADGQDGRKPAAWILAISRSGLREHQKTIVAG
jgi:hypothetical protein